MRQWFRWNPRQTHKFLEITAVPELLELLDSKNAIVTADTMSCQAKIAALIKAKEADCVICPKGNQANLSEDVKLYFESFMDTCSSQKTPKKGHGRIENRTYFLSSEVDWFTQKSDWANLNAIDTVKSTVESCEIRTETRYFITALTKIDEFAQAVREHLGIENQLHWCLDVVFREDASRAKRGNSPLNLNVLRKTALPLLQAANFGRMGLRKKMIRAALSIPTLEHTLTEEK